MNCMYANEVENVFAINLFCKLVLFCFVFFSQILLVIFLLMLLFKITSPYVSVSLTFLTIVLQITR